MQTISKPLTKKAQAEIELEKYLETVVVTEHSLRDSGGSAFVVPSSSSSEKYVVYVDENYNIIKCKCQGGNGNCRHKKAVARYLAPLMTQLLNKRNHVYSFYRQDKPVVCRLSQFSPAEKKTLDAAHREAELRAGFILEFGIYN